MDVFATYRDDVKKAVKDKETSFNKILTISDKVRDEALPEFGIRLEDQGGDKNAVWKFQPKEEILEDRRQKKEAAEEKNQKKRRG